MVYCLEDIGFEVNYDSNNIITNHSGMRFILSDAKYTITPKKFNTRINC